MPNSEAIVAAAREWVGTPYRHQQRVKDWGVDCAGLILGVGIELGILKFSERSWQQWSRYSRLPNPRRMLGALLHYLDWDPVGSSDTAPASGEPPARDMHLNFSIARELRTVDIVHRPGRVLWLQWRPDLPMHLAICSTIDGRPAIVHAYEPVCACVEHEFDDMWARRVHSAWSYRS